MAFSNLSDELINSGQNSTLRTTILLQAGIILSLIASGIYGMALVPDAIFYLRVRSTEELAGRVLGSGSGFDYWESGMDLGLGNTITTALSLIKNSCCANSIA